MKREIIGINENNGSKHYRMYSYGGKKLYKAKEYKSVNGTSNLIEKRTFPVIKIFKS